MANSPLDSLVRAFSEDHVERLTGLSKRQLRYWDNTGFFSPSLADENRRAAYSRVYSFKDIASLRVLGALVKRYKVPLSHLREVASKLSHLEDNKWTRVKLFVLNKRVNFFDPEAENLREVVSGQYGMGEAIDLSDYLSDTKSDIERLYLRTDDQIGVVERRRRVASNAWVVAGTRIPIKAIRGFHEAGYSIQDILKEYPVLTEKDVKAALEHDTSKAA